MGLFSRKKKSQEGIHIRGFPGHVDTCKCLYLAAEKGVPLNPELLDLAELEHKTDAFHALSPFEKIPCLGDGDFVISGVAAILPYIDVKGDGQSLTPRKAARLGEQNYWIEVGQNEVLPLVSTLLEEQVLKPMSDPTYTPDQEKIDAAVTGIDRAFSLADKNLEGREYFASDYTFADIHWVPYLHFCDISGHGELIEKYPNLKLWFDRIKARKNGTRNTCSVLPSLDQIKGKELRYVA